MGPSSESGADAVYFVTLILKNLLQRKTRSGLTVLGVAVAVAAFTSLHGIADGFERSLLNVYERRGVDLIVVRAGAKERLTSALPEALADRLAALPGVRKVSASLIDVGTFEEQQLIGVLVQGWPLDSLLFNELRFREGRPIQAGDRRAAMIGSVLARNLGKNLGDPIELLGEEFRIIGIFESFSIYENGSAIMPLLELQEIMGRPGQVTAFMIILESVPEQSALAADVRRRIEELRSASGQPLRLAALPATDFVSSTFQIRLAQAMAWVTTTIALVIGAIGILNTMLMSLYERTREIGLLRALGWRKARVMRMVLYEAVFISLLGAALGVNGGALLARGLSAAPEVSGFIEGTIAGPVMAKALLIALAIGLLGGAYPAYRAARLLPSVALRHE